MIAELDGAVLVHDRHAAYDSEKLGGFTHQLCCRHLLRDVDGAAEVYPVAQWPPQVARALRSLIHQASLARAEAIDLAVRDQLIDDLRHGVRVGLSETTRPGDRPGGRKPRPGVITAPPGPNAHDATSAFFADMAGTADTNETFLVPDTFRMFPIRSARII